MFNVSIDNFYVAHEICRENALTVEETGKVMEALDKRLYELAKDVSLSKLQLESKCETM